MISEKEFNKIMKKYFSLKNKEQSSNPYEFSCNLDCDNCILKDGDCDPVDTIAEAVENLAVAKETIEKVERWGKAHMEEKEK